MSHVQCTLDALDGLTNCESLVLLVTEDERPVQGAAGLVDWRLCGELSRAFQSGFFKGTHLERLLVPAQGRVPVERVFVLGIGPSRQVTAMGFETAVQTARETLVKAGVKSTVFALPSTKLEFAELEKVLDRVLVNSPVRYQVFTPPSVRA